MIWVNFSPFFSFFNECTQVMNSPSYYVLDAWNTSSKFLKLTWNFQKNFLELFPTLSYSFSVIDYLPFWVLLNKTFLFQWKIHFNIDSKAATSLHTLLSSKLWYHLLRMESSNEVPNEKLSWKQKQKQF